MSYKAAKSMAKLISQSCGESQYAVCFSREDRAIWRPPEHSWMSDRLKKKAWVKADCSTFSSIKHMCCWCIDVANKWWWKVYLLKLCVHKTPFGKSGHIQYFILQLHTMIMNYSELQLHVVMYLKYRSPREWFHMPICNDVKTKCWITSEHHIIIYIKF